MANQEYLTERWLEKKLRLQGAFLEWKGQSYNMRMIEHAEIVQHPFRAEKYRNMLYLFLLQWISISVCISICAIQWFEMPLALLLSSLSIALCLWKRVPPMRPVMYIRLFHSSITIPIHRNEIPQAEAFLEKMLKAGECK